MNSLDLLKLGKLKVQMYYISLFPEVDLETKISIKEKRMIIKDWNPDDQPREKLFIKGSLALTDTELLAILIGSGNKSESALTISRKILSGHEQQLSLLSGLGVRNLMKFKGVGKTKAIGIIAALELGKRACQRIEGQTISLNSSRKVFELMRPLMGGLDHEEFWIILLNNANRVACKWKLSVGGITATLVDVRLIYKKALAHGATSIILCHNHPSGNLKPSKSDILLTQKVIKGGRILDISVLDHVIVTQDDYYSFADEGTL